MCKFRGVIFVLCLALLCATTGGLFNGHSAVAAEGEAPPEDSIELVAQYPVLENTIGSSFNFEVTVDYKIKERRTFDLNLTLPPGWNGTPKSSPEETAISAFEPEPQNLSEKIIIEVWPVSRDIEPGENVFTFSVASGDLQASIDLTAITVEPLPTYSLSMSTTTGQSQMQVKSGEEKHLSIMISNSATGEQEDITLSAEKPEGWNVSFTPNRIKTLEPGLSQEIDVAVQSSSDSEPGDYPLIIKANSQKSETDIDLRVTVQTSTAWGGIGIGIAAGVIAGLIVWFRRMGKR